MMTESQIYDKFGSGGKNTLGSLYSMKNDDGNFISNIGASTELYYFDKLTPLQMIPRRFSKKAVATNYRVDVRMDVKPIDTNHQEIIEANKYEEKVGTIKKDGWWWGTGVQNIYNFDDFLRDTRESIIGSDIPPGIKLINYNKTNYSWIDFYKRGTSYEGYEKTAIYSGIPVGPSRHTTNVDMTYNFYAMIDWFNVVWLRIVEDLKLSVAIDSGKYLINSSYRPIGHNANAQPNPESGVSGSKETSSNHSFARAIDFMFRQITTTDIFKIIDKMNLYPGTPLEEINKNFNFNVYLAKYGANDSLVYWKTRPGLCEFIVYFTREIGSSIDNYHDGELMAAIKVANAEGTRNGNEKGIVAQEKVKELMKKLLEPSDDDDESTQKSILQDFSLSCFGTMGNGRMCPISFFHLGVGRDSVNDNISKPKHVQWNEKTFEPTSGTKITTIEELRANRNIFMRNLIYSDMNEWDI